jgi:hypothetical protein
MKVFVYFNLHRKVWSIKALNGPHAGRVIAHAIGVALRNVECRVSEAGRQRVIREQRKNVHAGLVGELYAVDGTWRVEPDALPALSSLPLPSDRAVAITYNPYKAGTFVERETGNPVYGARAAVLGARSVQVVL